MINIAMLFDLRFYAVVFQTYFFLHEKDYEKMGEFLPANRVIRSYLEKTLTDVQLGCEEYRSVMHNYMEGHFTSYDVELDYMMQFFRYNRHLNQIQNIKQKLQNITSDWNHNHIVDVEQFLTEHTLVRCRILTDIEVFENIKSAIKKAREKTKNQRIREGLEFIKRSKN